MLYDLNQLFLTRVLVGSFLLEITEIVEAWLEFSSLNAMNDFNNLVVHRGGEAYFSAIFWYSSVDGIDFGQFAFLQVLKHAGLELGVLADGDGNDEEREDAFLGVRVVEQFHDVLSLYRFDTYSAHLTDVDTFLDQGLYDAAWFLRTGCLAEGTS